MNTYLALDLGGTKLMIAEVTEEGKILRSKQYKSGFSPNRFSKSSVSFFC